jgi:hypothetical protein
MPQHQIRLQLRASKIQEAVAEAQLLGGQLLSLSSGHGNGGRERGTNDPKAGRPDLDISTIEIGVPGLGRSRRHISLDEHD